ncbi:MAG: hypothetical protein D8B60_13140 [Moraxella sp.]|nr:MAG: hypothetical protein D8B60_13140 [Moraxella sp.]
MNLTLSDFLDRVEDLKIAFGMQSLDKDNSACNEAYIAHKTKNFLISKNVDYTEDVIDKLIEYLEQLKSEINEGK